MPQLAVLVSAQINSTELRLVWICLRFAGLRYTSPNFAVQRSDVTMLYSTSPYLTKLNHSSALLRLDITSLRYTSPDFTGLRMKVCSLLRQTILYCVWIYLCLACLCFCRLCYADLNSATIGCNFASLGKTPLCSTSHGCLLNSAKICFAKLC